MANYSVLKAAVQAVVKTNGNQEITGANMQSTLISIINSLGTGYQFMGVATPSTSPGTPDYNVAYIGGAGTYANFGTSVTVPVGSICVFKYNGSWAKEQIALFAGIDDVPTAGSNNLVKSGGVYEKITNLDSKIDKSIAYSDKSNYYFTQIGGVVYSTGARGGSSNFNNYYFTNDGYSRVHVYAGALASDTGSAVIAFYSDTTLSASNYISGIPFNGVTGYDWYEAEVPNNCKLIVIAPKNVPYPNYEAYLIKPMTSVAPFIDASQSTLTQSVGTTGISINKSDCDLHNALTTSGQYTSSYQMTTHPIRVKAGQTINLTANQVDVDGTMTTIQERVAFYSDEHISSFVSVVKSAYDALSSFSVPDGANYMRISISLGSHYTRDYYTDGDLSVNYTSTDFLFDFTLLSNDVHLSRYGRWNEMRDVDFYKGSWQISNGVLNHGWTANGYCSNSPLIVQAGDYITMKRPNTSMIYLYGGVFLDASLNVISGITPDNYLEILVPNNARYLFLNLRSFPNNAIVLDDTVSFMFNISPRSYYDNEWNIIRQNDKIDTFAKLINLKQPAKVNSVLQTAPLSILFFSDIHGDKGNLERIMEFYNYWNSTGRYDVYIDSILSGGDSVQISQSSGAFDYWSQVNGAANILQTIGNHDAQDAASQKSVYDIEFAPFISNWNVTQPTNAATLGLMYYYKDFTTQKIRLVVLDCMYWDSTQLTWFESVLSSAKTNGYSVIGCVHYPVGSTTTINCNFLSMDYNPTGGARFGSAIAAVDDFINSGGEFICWLGGHTHSDGFGTVAEHPNQLNLLIDTARYGSSAAQDAAALVGTRTQDCFNILGFDTYSKLIKVVRVGRDYDRHLRHIGEMCVDYENKVVLYTR